MRRKILSLTKKDFEIQTFRAGGPGGQNQNKVESAVRIIHRESGAVGEARDSRDQPVNKKNAFLRLSKSVKFRKWLNDKIADIEIEERVQELMKPENIKVEYLGEESSIRGMA